MKVVEQVFKQSHHNGYSKVSSIKCVTITVIIVALHGSAKGKEGYKAEVVQMQVGMFTTKASVRLDNPFK